MSKPALSLASHFLSFITAQILQGYGEGYGEGSYKSVASTGCLLFSITKRHHALRHARLYLGCETLKTCGIGPLVVFRLPEASGAAPSAL